MINGAGEAPWLQSGAVHKTIYTVSQLNREAKTILWETFPSLWVEGEISNLARPASGHFYFTLKDSEAQVRCAIFRSKQKQLAFIPENGDHVLVKARVTVYEPRGDFQLIVEQMEEAGDGALKRAFDVLMNRLSKEGLFDSQLKLSLPKLPKQIGIITSPSGAAVHDILTVLKRRFAAIPAIVYPVSVQGKNATADLVRGIEIACARNECDVIILARGGGSLEDLWAFNEEPVARAIARCQIPIVTGIGHEVDFTIADFVADARAATPSAAAETVTPDQTQWLDETIRIEKQLTQCMDLTVQNIFQKLDWLNKRLDQQRPDKQLQNQKQRLYQLYLRITNSMVHHLNQKAGYSQALGARLRQHNPGNRINILVSHHSHLHHRLRQAVTHQLENGRQRMAKLGHALNTVSPLATLSRGYAIVKNKQNQIVRSYTQVDPGERVEATLGQGRLICTVEETNDE